MKLSQRLLNYSILEKRKLALSVNVDSECIPCGNNSCVGRFVSVHLSMASNSNLELSSKQQRKAPVGMS